MNLTNSAIGLNLKLLNRCQLKTNYDGQYQVLVIGQLDMQQVQQHLTVCLYFFAINQKKANQTLMFGVNGAILKN